MLTKTCSGGSFGNRTIITQQLSRILETTAGERAVAAFVREHPILVLLALVRFGDGNCVVSEFPIGTEYRADFVALAPFSGGWEIHFVELEPPTERLFNKDGTMAKRLNKANSQIDSWRIHFSKNRDTMLHDLSRYAKERDLITGPRNSEPTCHAGWPMYHPRSWLHIHFDIVIGRRAELTDSQLEAKASFVDHHKIEVMTYDRFLDAAKHADVLESINAEPGAAPNRGPARPPCNSGVTEGLPSVSRLLGEDE